MKRKSTQRTVMKMQRIQSSNRAKYLHEVFIRFRFATVFSVVHFPKLVDFNQVNHLKEWALMTCYNEATSYDNPSLLANLSPPPLTIVLPLKQCNQLTIGNQDFSERIYETRVFATLADKFKKSLSLAQPDGQNLQ